MSQDLFAAFGSEEKAPATKTSSHQSSVARHNPAGPPKPLDLDAILNAKPYDEFTTTNVSLEDDDDDFGDFEDASPMDEEAKAAILKARMGSPLPNAEMPFFDVPTAKPVSPSKPRTTWKSAISPVKSRAAPPTTSSSSYKPTPVSNLPFKPKPAEPIRVPTSSSRSQAASKTSSTLPFKPKPAQPESKAENIGSHPFAGRMDMLFDADDDEYDAGADDLNVDLANDPEAAMAYSKKLIADAMAHQKPQGPTASRSELPKQGVAPESNKPREKPAYVRAKNSDVLFDADNLSENQDDDDDWGTFESGSTELPKANDFLGSAMKSSGGALGIDLLGLDDTSAQWASSQTHHQSEPAIPKKQQQKPVQISQDDDAWDDFESVAPTRTPPTSTTPNLPQATISIAARADPTNAPTLPPTNIPPPAVLLSVFPSLFASAQEALFDTLTKIPQDQKQELLSHEATHQFLRGYVGLSVVLAHIISGRKQRWKRDQFLAQGMRIGPAAAGGKGGMKLAGVDKSETAKEDREVLDAVRQWRSVVGKLRSAVSGANVKAATKLPLIPEISEQMPVKALKPTEGGIVAPHACALCGLKREERVFKVDEGVDDSFGEWWVQGMNMHLLCKNFWDSHSGQMRSR